MACLSSKKINEYIEGELNPIEAAVTKDHLIMCKRCNHIYTELKSIEDSLLSPVLNKVPSGIEKVIMRKLNSEISYYSSLSALIIAVFMFLITSLYLIFDFANNSLIRSFENISANSSGVVSSVIKFISGTFQLLYTVLSSCNTLLKTLFNINTGVGFLAVFSTCLSLILIFLIYSRVNKRKQSNE
jgi:hypothetical protein